MPPSPPPFSVRHYRRILCLTVDWRLEAEDFSIGNLGGGSPIPMIAACPAEQSAEIAKTCVKIANSATPVAKK